MFSGPMPRISIWRLLPRLPLALLPVKFTPGILRMMSEIVDRRLLSNILSRDNRHPGLLLKRLFRRTAHNHRFGILF